MTGKEISEVRSHLESLQNTEQDSAKKGRFDELITSLNEVNARIPEDRRLAAGLAVEAAKNFLQIAIAFVVLAAGLYQFGTQRDWNRPSLIWLIGSAILGLISMVVGFIVISTAYKRGDGIINDGDHPWSVQPLRGLLFWQSVTGLLALLTMGVAIGIPKAPSPEARVTVTSPAGSHTILPSDSLLVTSRWSPLTIEQKGRYTLRILPHHQDSTQTIVLKVRK